CSPVTWTPSPNSTPVPKRSESVREKSPQTPVSAPATATTSASVTSSSPAETTPTFSSTNPPTPRSSSLMEHAGPSPALAMTVPSNAHPATPTDQPHSPPTTSPSTFNSAMH